MCSPHIMKYVQERLVKEQKPGVSRRDFLRLSGAAAVGLAAAPALKLAPRRQAEMTGEVIDLSHVLGGDVPMFIGNPPAKEVISTIEANGFYAQSWAFGEHSGTHMDAPAHFSAEGVTVDALAPELFLSPAVVIDISAKVADDPDSVVTLEDLAAWEGVNGEIPVGAMVFMYSGWEERWSDPEAFRNAGEDGLFHFPGFGIDAVQFLLESRDIHGIGVDTISLDYGASTTYDVHVTLLGAGKYGVENVANLAQIKDVPASVFVGIPRYQDGSGGPCRVLAMI